MKLESAEKSIVGLGAKNHVCLPEHSGGPTERAEKVPDRVAQTAERCRRPIRPCPHLVRDEPHGRQVTVLSGFVCDVPALYQFATVRPRGHHAFEDAHDAVQVMAVIQSTICKERKDSLDALGTVLHHHYALGSHE